jgi:uncharacterized protein (UPF0262 family)
MSQATINKLQLREEHRLIAPNHLKREQQTALKDLLQNAHFQPLNDNDGPYDVTLSIEQGRLVIFVKNAQDKDLSTLVLSLRPYKSIIRDYFLMIESYEKARHNATREKLEAIDMGRRGLHNEGANLLMDRLKDKIELNFETARRFFTLICVLHADQVRLSR